MAGCGPVEEEVDEVPWLSWQLLIQEQEVGLPLKPLSPASQQGGGQVPLASTTLHTSVGGDGDENRITRELPASRAVPSSAAPKSSLEWQSCWFTWKIAFPPSSLEARDCMWESGMQGPQPDWMG